MALAVTGHSIHSTPLHGLVVSFDIRKLTPPLASNNYFFGKDYMRTALLFPTNVPLSKYQSQLSVSEGYLVSHGAIPVAPNNGKILIQVTDVSPNAGDSGWNKGYLVGQKVFVTKNYGQTPPKTLGALSLGRYDQYSGGDNELGNEGFQKIGRRG